MGVKKIFHRQNLNLIPKSNSLKLFYLYYFIRLYDLIKGHTLSILGMNLKDNKKEFQNKTSYVYNYLNKRQ